MVHGNYPSISNRRQQKVNGHAIGFAIGTKNFVLPVAAGTLWVSRIVIDVESVSKDFVTNLFDTV